MVSLLGKALSRALDSEKTKPPVTGWKRRTKGDAYRSGREERQAQAGVPRHWG